MSLRYARRRPSTTALVVGGLLVGTAIISASFTVSDTLDSLITDQATTGLGELDFSVASSFGGSFVYLPSSMTSSIVQNISSNDRTTFAGAASIDSAVVINNASKLSSLNTRILGINDATASGLGGFIDLDGNRLLRSPTSSGAFIPKALALDIDAHQGEVLILIRGNLTLPLVVERIVESSELGGYQIQSGGFQASTSMFINQSTLGIWTGNYGSSNIILISVQGHEVESADSVRATIDEEISLYPEFNLRIIQDRQEILKDGKETLSTFTSLFFVFGSFSVIAGVALVLNIFTMLGEERKSEMGITRAIGMSRGTLRRLFTYEGVIYAALAAGIGTIVGVGLAYVIILSISNIFEFSGLRIDQYFTFTSLGLAYAYLAGFMITIATVYLATARISNMNIVRAVRNVPDPPVDRMDRRSFLLGMMMLISGFPLLFIGMELENLGMALSGVSLFTLSIGLLGRRFVGDRLAWNLAGLTTLIVWLSIPFGFKLFPYDAEIEMLVVAGLFMLASVLLLVMFNSNAIIFFFTTTLRVRSSYRAVIKTAISYPLKAKVRTGLSIFIFGLVIFTVTILSMVSGILNYNIPIMIEETSGGFDTIAFTLNPTTVLPEDAWDMINATSGPLSPQNVTNVISIATMSVRVNGTRTTGSGERSFEFDTLGLGIGERFYTQGVYPLADWNRTAYGSEQDVWQAVMANGSLAIIDGSLRGSVNQFGMTSDMSSLILGETVRVMAYDGTTTNVTIIGIMKQSTLGGIFVNTTSVYDNFRALGINMFLISYSSDLDAQEQSVLLEKEFLDYGVSTISVKALAEEVTKGIDSIFTLFRAFLAMGLVIGIAGLGIMTIRSIYERRLEIGMMRAIGFTKRMVVVNFALESSFISLLGIVVGSMLGILVGYQLWVEGLKGQDFVFVIDWAPIIIVGTLAFLATMLSVLPAARGASRVSPAEVLRFE